jgi:hypothetical protein
MQTREVFNGLGAAQWKTEGRKIIRLQQRTQLISTAPATLASPSPLPRHPRRPGHPSLLAVAFPPCCGPTASHRPRPAWTHCGATRLDPPERPRLTAHRRSWRALPTSPWKLLLEHGALLTFLAGSRGLDERDLNLLPAEWLREKGLMLMFRSELTPPECPPPCFWLLPAPSCTSPSPCLGPSPRLAAPEVCVLSLKGRIFASSFSWYPKWVIYLSQLLEGVFG